MSGLTPFRMIDPSHEIADCAYSANGWKVRIPLKNSKIAVSFIFAIGVKYRKSLPGLLALIHRCFRVAILEN